jgi:hypothetical protein
MKKLTSLILVFVCVFSCLLSLVGCDPATARLDTAELLANTVKIELVNYENSNPKLIHNLDGKKKPTFDFNKVTLIATLDDSKIEDVVKDIGEYGYLYWDRTWNEPIGKTLILYQNNGDILVFYGCIYTNEKGDTYYPGACIMFDKDGKYIEYIGDFGYSGMDAIISQYFSSLDGM